MRPPCAVCRGAIPCPPPEEPDVPEAWHTSFRVGGREFFVHYSCWELQGPLGCRAFAAALGVV